MRNWSRRPWPRRWGCPGPARRLPADRLIGYLADRDMLVVLDSFEHLLPAAPLIAELVTHCPGLLVLVTSRAALRLRAEEQLRVPPLAVPPAEQRQLPELAAYPAVELFAARARAVRGDFALDSVPTAVAVAEVCRRLDGLPLAIELAAARVGILTPADLARHLGTSLDVLGEGPRDLPSRQRTLRAAIDWSHSLLPGPAQLLFARMAVFHGGSSADSLTAVGGPGVLSALEALVEHSLVLAVDADGGRRFDMLQTIHEYACDRLLALGEAEADKAAQRHAAYFLALAESAESALHGPGQLAWLNRLDSERDNIEAALRWARDHGDWQAGLRLVSALWWYWSYHGSLRTGRQWIEELLAGCGGQPPDTVLARALAVAGWLSMHQGDITRARQQLEQARTLAEQCGSAWTSAFALTGIGSAGVWAGDPDREQQRALLQDARDRWLQLGNPGGLLHANGSLGALALFEGDLPRAQSVLQQCLDIARQTGAPYAVAHSSCLLGIAARARGDIAEAAGWFGASLRHAHAIGDPFIMAYALEGLAGLARAAGEMERAARLIGAAQTLRTMIGSPVADPQHAARQADIDALRDSLGADRFDALTAAVRMLPLDEVISAELNAATHCATG